MLASHGKEFHILDATLEKAHWRSHNQSQIWVPPPHMKEILGFLLLNYLDQCLGLDQLGRL